MTGSTSAAGVGIFGPGGVTEFFRRSHVVSSSANAAPGPRSIEQRLAELDDLRTRGVISDDEHRDARAAILKG